MKKVKKLSSIVLAGRKRLKQLARECLAKNYDIRARSAGNKDMFLFLAHTTIGELKKRIEKHEALSYKEAFCGMCYVLAATNSRFFDELYPVFKKAYKSGFSKQRALVLGNTFLIMMSLKASGEGLTPEEIAGMVAATMMDTVIALKMSRVIETCGMGGDKGFSKNSTIRKTINVSTLSAQVLLACGLPVIKHGSYGNTSKVGSTEAIEWFGALTSMTTESQIWQIWKKSGFCYFDAHLCKTVHDLSHLLEFDTINHVLGPTTLPISSDTQINKVMGVNKKVHPEVMAKVCAILHQKGVLNVGGFISVAGLDESGKNISVSDYDAVKKHVILDEVSPYASVISATFGGKYLGTCMLYPEDFGISIDPSKIQVPNDKKAIHKANVEALCGTNPHLTNYLAMNAALGLYAMEYLHKHGSIVNGLNKVHLRECFKRCHTAIVSGKAKAALAVYVEATGGTLKL